MSKPSASWRPPRCAPPRRRSRRPQVSLGERKLVVGVDRLDYSKGIVQRLEAFGQFLRSHPEHRGRVGLLQIAPPSRTDVPEYAELDRQSDETAGRLNAALGEFDWTPIRVVKKAYSRSALAGFYRRAQVGLVTPMRDGMNLVAKEYIAAQDPADPGVLVLSRFAGAAQQLGEALIVNPYDTHEVAEAIRTALAMPKSERVRAVRAPLRDDRCDRYRLVDEALSRCAVGHRDRAAGCRAADGCEIQAEAGRQGAVPRAAAEAGCEAGEPGGPLQTGGAVHPEPRSRRSGRRRDGEQCRNPALRLRHATCKPLPNPPFGR